MAHFLLVCLLREGEGLEIGLIHAMMDVTNVSLSKKLYLHYSSLLKGNW